MSDLYSNPFPDFGEFIESAHPDEAGESLISMFSSFAQEAADRHKLDKDFRHFFNIIPEDEPKEKKDKNKKKDKKGGACEFGTEDGSDKKNSPAQNDGKGESNISDKKGRGDKSDNNDTGDKSDNDGKNDVPQNEGDKDKDSSGQQNAAENESENQNESENDQVTTPKSGDKNDESGEPSGNDAQDGSDQKDTSDENDEGSEKDGDDTSDDEGLDEDYDDYDESDEDEQEEESDENGESDEDEQGEESSENDASDEGDSNDAGNKSDDEGLDDDYDDYDESDDDGKKNTQVADDQRIGASGSNDADFKFEKTTKYWEDRNKVVDHTVDDRDRYTKDQMDKQAQYLDYRTKKTVYKSDLDSKAYYEDDVIPNEQNVQALCDALSKFTSQTDKVLGFAGSINVKEFLKNRVREKNGELPSMRIFNRATEEQRIKMYVLLDGSGSFGRHYDQVMQIVADLFECANRISMDLEVWQGGTTGRQVSMKMSGQRRGMRRMDDVPTMTRVYKDGISSMRTNNGTLISGWLHNIADMIEKNPTEDTTLVLTIVDGEDYASHPFYQVAATSAYGVGMHSQKALNRMKAAGALPFTCLWHPNPGFIGRIAEFYKPNYYHVANSDDWLDLTTRFLSREALKQ